MQPHAPRYAAAYQDIECLFTQTPDPWEFGTDPYEVERIRRTVQLVARLPHGRVLEVGCAEGHMTQLLASISPSVTAIDVSATAVERARARARRAEILVSGLEDYEPRDRFDLVICAEAIYYPADTRAALKKLCQLAEFVLISYTRSERRRLDPIFSSIPILYDEYFRYFRVWDRGTLFRNSGTRILAFWSGAVSEMGDVTPLGGPARSLGMQALAAMSLLEPMPWAV